LVEREESPVEILELKMSSAWESMSLKGSYCQGEEGDFALWALNIE